MGHPFGTPPLSTASAHLLALLMGTIYVGSIYVSKNARLSFSSASGTNRNGNGNGEGTNGSESKPRFRHHDERWRDDPDVIRARLLAVCVATLLCCLAVFGVNWSCVGVTGDTLKWALHTTLLDLGFLTGFPLLNFNLSASALLPHLITPILYFGPLVGMAWRRELPGQKNWRWLHIKIKFFGCVGIRNYWVAPLTEEIVFRACVLAIYHLSGASRKKMIMFGPLVFGLAHVHHAWDTYNRYGRTSAAAKRAVLSSVFQLLYTTLFGMHVSFLFLRTGSVWPAVGAHAWCNTMGMPDVGHDVGRDEEYETTNTIKATTGDDRNGKGVENATTTATTSATSTMTADTSMTTTWTPAPSMTAGEATREGVVQANGHHDRSGDGPQAQREEQRPLRQRQTGVKERRRRTLRTFTVLAAYLVGVGAFVWLLRGGLWEDDRLAGKNVYWG